MLRNTYVEDRPVGMNEEAIADLTTLIKKARQRELPFGLCLGKKPEDNVMYLDLKKPPETMMRRAKADGETSKVTFGTCAVEGKIINLALQGKMLPGLAKNMKMFFIKNKLKFKVVILDADGGVLEADGDEDEMDGVDGGAPVDASDMDAGADGVQDTAEPEVAADAPQPDIPAPEGAQVDASSDPAAEQWSKVSAALTPLIAAFAQSGDARAPAVAKAWEGAEGAAQKSDYKSAMAVAGKLRAVVAGAPPAETATDPNAAKWAQLEDALSALYTKAMAKNPPNRSNLEARWAMATESAGSQDFTKALAIAAKLKPLLDEALAATSSGQEGEIPKDVVPFQKSRILWQKTREKMFDEMGKLEKAITAACSGEEDLAEVVQSVSSLTDRLKGFDTSLEDILEKITVTAAGPGREQLKKEAVQAIGTYQSALQDPFFQDVDSNNGFVNVKVAASANASLASISKVLAA